MASESLSRGVDLFFAQEFCFFKQEHGPPRGSKQARTDVLLTTVLGPLRCGWGGTGGSAMVTNRGWDTNAVLGHVDPHSVTESACAGSHTQTFSTNLCG